MIPDLRSPIFRQNWFRIKNASGSVIPPHSVVLANGTVSTSEGEHVMSVIQPNSSSTQFNFGAYYVTGPWAIGSSSSAEGWATDLLTPGFVAYNGSAPSAGAVYGPKHGQFTLESGYYGYGIIGGSTTSGGSNVVLAQWIGIPSLLGKTDASVTGGNSVTVSVYTGTAGSETDTSMNVTGVYLRYGYVPSSTFVHVTLNSNKLYIAGDHRTVVVKPDSAITKGSSGTCSIYNDESDTGDNITAKALGANVGSGKWATAWHEEKSGDWLVACWEQ